MEAVLAVDVRRAEQFDADWLIEQLYAFQAFAQFKHVLLADEAFARKQLAAIIEQHIVFIAQDSTGKRLGFIAGYLTPHPFNPKLRVLTEIFWWVPEEFRGSRAGAALLFRFEDYGSRVADWVILSLEHDSPIRAAHMARRGFRQVERAFLKEI